MSCTSQYIDANIPHILRLSRQVINQYSGEARLGSFEVVLQNATLCELANEHPLVVVGHLDAVWEAQIIEQHCGCATVDIVAQYPPGRIGFQISVAPHVERKLATNIGDVDNGVFGLLRHRQVVKKLGRSSV